MERMIIMKLTQKSIKKILNTHDLKIWQLCLSMNISKTSYYKYSHTNFKGHEKQFKKAINDLINSKGGVADAD